MRVIALGFLQQFLVMESLYPAPLLLPFLQNATNIMVLCPRIFYQRIGGNGGKWILDKIFLTVPLTSLWWAISDAWTEWQSLLGIQRMEILLLMAEEIRWGFREEEMFELNFEDRILEQKSEGKGIIVDEKGLWEKIWRTFGVIWGRMSRWFGSNTITWC